MPNPIHILIESLFLEGYGKNVELVVRKLKRVHNFNDLRVTLRKMENEGMIQRIDGGSRAIFSIDDDYILKTLRGKSHFRHPRLDQNRNESKPEVMRILKDYMPRIVARGPEYRWMVVEKAIPLKWSETARWMRAIGLSLTDSLDSLHSDFIQMALNQKSGQLPTDREKELQENDLTSRMFELFQHHGVAIDDFGYQNLVWSMSGRPMVIDVGLGR